ncbi:MAG: hypothetical protein HOD92_22935 [Deltaproteobacteria bacterium]|jgi:hypothetical protein|nr:hypothetical protein [Deltaproteobacteria bacterium]
MKRFFVSVILATLCLAGSSYIVLESAGYYQKLYILADLPGEMGWYTAILSEAFQFMLVILLPTRKENRIRWHALLVIIVLIYTITIFSAGMNVGKPFIEKWNRSKTNDKLYSILLEEQKALNGQIKLLHDQKQKLNTVISIKAGRHSFQEIKNHLKKELPVDSTLIQIELVALWLLRILIQLANLVCGRIIALSWKLNSIGSALELTVNNDIPIKQKVVKRWKAKYSRNDKGFIGILELDDGNFLSVSPKGKRRYQSFQRALNFFNGSPYRDKIPNDPT